MRISDWSSDVCSSDLERPEKSNKAHDAEAERNRDQIGEHAHWVASRAAAPCRRTRVPFVAGRYLAPMPRLSRVALATTRIEEADIANAATSGVTKPRTAKGKATALWKLGRTSSREGVGKAAWRQVDADQ